jgi:hypothetical protein
MRALLEGEGTYSATGIGQKAPVTSQLIENAHELETTKSRAR